MGSDIPPVPVSAVINAPKTQVVVTFDQPLVVDPVVDYTNWTATWNADNWVPTAAAVVGSTVVIDGAIGTPNITDDLIHFAPPPFDVIDRITALPVTAFSDFVLTG